MSKKKTDNAKPMERPPDEFLDWWYPSGTDVFSGASMGGHPDAERIWARKDPGKWTRRTYGVKATQAWLTDRYRREYETWMAAGRPKRVPEFTSIVAPMEKQRAFWRTLAQSLREIVKPMPKQDQQPKQLTNGQTIEGEFHKVEDDDDNTIDF